MTVRGLFAPSEACPVAAAGSTSLSRAPLQFAARLLEVGGAQQAVIAVAFEFVQLVTWSAWSAGALPPARHPVAPAGDAGMSSTTRVRTVAAAMKKEVRSYVVAFKKLFGLLAIRIAQRGLGQPARGDAGKR